MNLLKARSRLTHWGGAECAAAVRAGVVMKRVDEEHTRLIDRNGMMAKRRGKTCIFTALGTIDASQFTEITTASPDTSRTNLSCDTNPRRTGLENVTWSQQTW